VNEKAIVRIKLISGIPRLATHHCEIAPERVNASKIILVIPPPTTPANAPLYVVLSHQRPRVSGKKAVANMTSRKPRPSGRGGGQKYHFIYHTLHLQRLDNKRLP